MATSRDPATTSRIMAAVRSKDTEPEMLLRRELHRRGLRYRLHTKLPGRPDIVFPTVRLVVFVDGDFWHGHGWQERGFVSWQAQFVHHRDPDKWIAKIGRNIERDAEANELLTALSWKVVRALESQIRRNAPEVADEIAKLVRSGSRLDASAIT